MSNKSQLNLATLYDYIFSVSVRESSLLAALREETAKDDMSVMQIAPEQGQFMALVVKLLNASKIIEVGTYTGYSSLCMAQAMSDNGIIYCCDISEPWTNIAKRYWKEARIEHKIQLKLAPALTTLSQLLDEGHSNTFDMAFIDADKANYDAYYELCLALLHPNGLIMIDNVLWGGAVADTAINDADTRAIRALNKKLKNDSRVDISLLPVADGVTLARKRG